MMAESNLCFQQSPQGFQGNGDMEGLLSSSPSAAGVSAAPGVDAHYSSLLYNFSILRNKVQQVESVVGMVVSHTQIQQDSMPMAVSIAGTAVHEIISAASSMMFTFQQLALDAAILSDELPTQDINAVKVSHDGSSQPRSDVAVTGRQGGGGCSYLCGCEAPHEGYQVNNIPTSSPAANGEMRVQAKVEVGSSSYPSDGKLSAADQACEIIELGEADLLAKYTHYCQVCGKGFKRNANLRMHMRAHGDEYKTNAALSSPLKKQQQHGNTINKQLLGGFDGSRTTAVVSSGTREYYSCPQEGCRWNRKHPRFQPLKSMVCAKNHYKRSHCPKMYVCNRCNRKQFSVLSDLRTHEKHCGDLSRWQCSCGTTFSRKDKLMGHVALFVGHAPTAECLPKQGKA
ncbi:hypothetical protein Taro_019657 [Colocasia esculenta]|uniref:C2H2-type domain-containing protein n=1 Tax=Colocasia esculenta TaxID=4460 RepID=A0A843V651_COLES|nr:hypothetical protein [Colocasia esculenta]